MRSSTAACASISLSLSGSGSGSGSKDQGQDQGITIRVRSRGLRAEEVGGVRLEFEEWGLRVQGCGVRGESRRVEGSWNSRAAGFGRFTAGRLRVCEIKS
eukprot:754379-Rhodomonas_salina.1